MVEQFSKLTTTVAEVFHRPFEKLHRPDPPQRLGGREDAAEFNARIEKRVSDLEKAHDEDLITEEQGIHSLFDELGREREKVDAVTMTSTVILGGGGTTVTTLVLSPFEFAVVLAGGTYYLVIRRESDGTVLPVVETEP